MITKFITGNIVSLLARNFHVAHGCNCFHTMGAGVAGQLAERFPIILSTDKAGSDFGDCEKLGTFTTARVGTAYCFNMYTQYEPGPNVDYLAITKAFSALNEMSSYSLIPMTVHIPRIGCGIAGGDWQVVERIIDSVTPNVDIIVVDWDGK